MTSSKWILAAVAVLMLSGGAMAQGVVIGVADGPGVKVQVGGPGVHVEVGKPSKYWIGVALAGPVQESEDEPGLKVAGVMPDSPAAKAGIQPGDRLLKAGGNTVQKIGDLTAAIDAAEGKPLAVEVARKGETIKLEITPIQRDSAALSEQGALPPGHDVEALRQWIDNLEHGRFGERGPFQFRFFGPGAIVPGTSAGEPQPDDMTITITKKGDSPARVTVKQGDETWKTTVDELSTLPDEVRPHVERLLGRRFGGAWGRVKVLEGPQVEVQPLEPRAIRPDDSIRRHLDEQMEQLHKQLDEMNKRIEELQKKRHEPAKKPDKA